MPGHLGDNGVASDDPVDWAKVYRKKAREVDSMGNFASGMGWYDLANRLWTFGGHLRRRAKDIRERKLKEGGDG